MTDITTLDYYKANGIIVALLSNGILRARRNDGLEWVVTLNGNTHTTTTLDYPEKEFSSILAFHTHVSQLPTTDIFEFTPQQEIAWKKGKYVPLKKWDYISFFLGILGWLYLVFYICY